MSAGQAPYLAKAHFAAAVTSSQCASTLAQIDSRWGQGCGPTGVIIDDTRPLRGCSVGGSEASIGVLRAVVAALVARRGR